MVTVGTMFLSYHQDLSRPLKMVSCGHVSICHDYEDPLSLTKSFYVPEGPGVSLRHLVPDGEDWACGNSVRSWAAYLPLAWE